MKWIEAWCNGNTQDFGSWFGGSSPLASTNYLSISYGENFKERRLATES